jgi:hypothetical protein
MKNGVYDILKARFLIEDDSIIPRKKSIQD